MKRHPFGSAGVAVPVIGPGTWYIDRDELLRLQAVVGWAKRKRAHHHLSRVPRRDGGHGASRAFATLRWFRRDIEIEFV